ncbi:MAG: hypothetical protein JWP88_964 [Flaviaesturariibacter sp.]|nr:hypothetical protein [Flaviaesturariibacter sp.]
MLTRVFLYIFFLLTVAIAQGQTLGGAAVYNFLKLPPSPALSAAGGVNVSYASNDVGLAMNNPALLNESFHKLAAANFNAYFAGIKAYQLAGAHHVSKWNTTLGAGLSYINYGTLSQVDAAGNEQGFFHPVDFVLQVSAAKTYLEKWQYGLSAKLIYSSYGQYRSAGLAFDFGLLYQDTTRFFSVGLVAKNMGVQLSSYNGSKEELPFDLQIGITKRLLKAPFGFSLTAQQVHRFKLAYNDTTFNNENSFTAKPDLTTNLFNHLVLATHVYFGKNLEATLGYNFLRRNELTLGTSGNGLNGFSAGFKAHFSKLEFQYARAYFQRGGAYNQFGVNLNLNKVLLQAL